MGWDVYMRWKGQTEAEKEAQYTDCSALHGHVGYLRQPQFPFPESHPGLFDDGAQIPASELREAIASTYAKDPEVIASYRAFVELAERKEVETGEPVTILII